MSVEEALDAFSMKCAEHYMKAAEHAEQAAMFRAAAASTEFEKEKTNLRTAEIQQDRVRNANRPSLMLGARLVRVEQPGGRVIYTASYAGLTIDGDTPEIAFQNFDEMWTQGEEHE